MGLTASVAAAPPMLPEKRGLERPEAPSVRAHVVLPVVLPGARDARVVTDVQTFYDATTLEGTKHTIAATGVRQQLGRRVWVQAAGGVARTSYRFDRGLPCSGAMPAFLAGIGANLGNPATTSAEIGLRGWTGVSGGNTRSIHVVALTFDLRWR
jgi:hypothetical protein